ncbi:MAG: hypothetical protein ACI85O_003388 [Saprospiraceae bacterium]|jgi:hypothetical protein
MKKFLIKSILFFLFASVIYIAGICIWGEYMPNKFKPNLIYVRGGYGHTHTRMKDVKKVHDIDILFLGSSHTYRGFDTRIFKKSGYSSFNLGTSSQTPIQTKLLLKRYLKTLNPKLVIYETYPKAFKLDGVESSLDILVNDKNDFESIKMALKVNSTEVYNTLIYTFFKEITKNTHPNWEAPNRGTEHYKKNGYVQSDKLHYRHEKHEKTTLKPNPNSLDRFEENLQFLKENNYPFLLVQAPITPAYYQSFTNNSEYDSLMNEYGEYYNFNEISRLDDSLHFYDIDHLSHSGVELFNADLLRLIKENSIFED